MGDHHVYDHSARTLQNGSGDRRGVQSIAPVIRRAAGDGLPVSSGNGGPATMASVLAPRTVAVGPDGSVYVGEPGRIRKIDRRTGLITAVAGNGSTSYNGAQNVPAAQASFDPTDIAVAGDGSILIADETNRRLFRIRNGMFRVVAGNGQSGSASEGATAVQQPVEPHGVAAVGDCIAYIADRAANKIWRVMCDGRIYTVAGNGTYADPLSENAATSGFAVEVPLPGPEYVAVDEGGRVFFSAAGNGLYRVDPNGLFSRLTPAEETTIENDSVIRRHRFRTGERPSTSTTAIVRSRPSCVRAARSSILPTAPPESSKN